jgi:hypothetical protein
MLLFLQIGELFKGNFNWRGVLHLTVFIIMGLIIIGFSAFFIWVVLKSGKKKSQNPER